MNGIVAVVIACSRVLSSRIEAQFMSFGVIFSIDGSWFVALLVSLVVGTRRMADRPSTLGTPKPVVPRISGVPYVGEMAEPRTRTQRIADSAALLEHVVDCWVATSGPDGAWLVPLSFVWWEDELLLATDRSSRTCRNIEADPRVRIGLGPTRDVVMLDGRAVLTAAADLTRDEVDAYVEKCGSDPRGWADTVVRVRLDRAQAWREENELRGRTLMRDGRWLED